MMLGLSRAWTIKTNDEITIECPLANSNEISGAFLVLVEAVKVCFVVCVPLADTHDIKT